MTKASNQIPLDKLALYEKLIATHLEIERKGQTMPYTSTNGHMFSILSKTSELGLRLPKADRQDFIGKYKTSLFVQYGAVMIEYVAVPEELLANTDELKPYLGIGLDYAKTLKLK